MRSLTRFSFRARSGGVRWRVMSVATAAMLAPASTAWAQQRLAANNSAWIMPLAETWSFGDGLLQTTLRGDTVRLTRARRLSLPVGAEMHFGERWQFAVTAAFVNSRVSLKSSDAGLNVDEYELNGVTDVKLSLTTHIVPDKFLVTVGLNVPPSGTELDADELEAVRVFAAPALSFEVPSMGLGNAATAGVVYARELAGWAWAFGASYELRSGSTPLVVASGLSAVDFSPSDAVHLSLGVDGLVGPHAMTVALTADIFSDDEYLSGGQPITGAATRLGPILTAEWQLRLAALGIRELVVYVTDRYRTPYSRGGAEIPESHANYLDAGVNGVAPLSPRLGLIGGVAFRYQTGLRADSSVASAAAQVGSATLGLRYERGRYLLQPFVRGQIGRLDTWRETADANEIVGGLTLTTRF